MNCKLITLLAAASIALAQPPGRPGGAGPANFDAVQQYLGLSDALVTNLTQLRAAESQEAQTLRQSIQQKHQAIQAGLQNGASAAALGQLLLDIQNLQKQVDTIRAKYETQAVALLTADQKAKLKNLADAQALQANVHQAVALQLLSPPAGSAPGLAGPGPFGRGARFRRGPIGQ